MGNEVAPLDSVSVIYNKNLLRHSAHTCLVSLGELNAAQSDKVCYIHLGTYNLDAMPTGGLAVLLSLIIFFLLMPFLIHKVGGVQPESAV